MCTPYSVQCSVELLLLYIIRIYILVRYLPVCGIYSSVFFSAVASSAPFVVARLGSILFSSVLFILISILFSHCLWVNKRFIITVSISFDVCLLAQCSYLFPFCHFSHPMPFHFTIPFSFAFNFMILL